MDATTQPAEPTITEDEVESEPEKFIGWVLDRWIQILGIVFLLLGVGFLFKYSYEHGLFTPPLRVLSGLGIATTLAFVGFRLRQIRERLSHVLLGGSSVSFYITIYAASELYELLWEPLAFAGMMAVTMATFVVATMQRQAVLANIAAIGGFLTPFVLDTPILIGSPFEEMGTLVYMCIVLAGTTAIYLFRGWRSVLLTSAVAMWSYLALVAMGASTPLERAGGQVAIVLTWLATAVVPIARVYLLDRDGEDDGAPLATSMLAHFLAFTVPGFAMLLSRAVWDLPDLSWGLVSVLAAAVYGAAAGYFRQQKAGSLETTHTLIAVGFATLALTDVLSGSSLMIGLLVEAVALCWLGHETAEERDGEFTPLARLERSFRGRGLVSVIGHVLLGIVFMNSVSLFAAEPASAPFIGAEGLQMLLTSVAFVIVGRFHEAEAVRPGFEWAAHLLGLGTVLHQSMLLSQHGDIVSTAIWGVYSLALITAGLATRSQSRQWMGLVALLLTASKLLFVDMSGAETLWRVLLFLGFGVALLALNYLAPRWTGGGEASSPSAGNGRSSQKAA